MGYFDEAKKKNELAHHGILGQKWGVRRFQNKNGVLTAEGRKHVAENKQKKGLTDAQKKAIVTGAAVTASILAAYGGYRLYQYKKNKDAQFDSKTGLQLKSKSFSPDQDMMAVNQLRRYNPIFNFAGHYSNNCMLCTATYDLRRRGFDVKASEELHGRYGTDLASIYKFKDAKDFTSREKYLDGSTEKFIKQVKEFGPNARGNLTITSMFGGHSIAWENDAKGNTTVRDCQLNLKMNTKSALNAYFNQVGMKPKVMMRLDDLELNTDGLKNGQWVRNNKELSFGMSEVQGLLATTGAASIAGTAVGYKTLKNEEERSEVNDNSRTSENDNREKSTKKR